MKKLHLLLCLLSLSAINFAQPPEANPDGNSLGWQAETFGAFVVSLCRDRQGGVWVGTEGNGVWRFDAGRRSWKQWTVSDGLGDDNVYALACDAQGRVWAGHLRSGVSVWNGIGWKNFGVLNGPLGERVFDIAISPMDGDVWMATNAGLSRYQQKGAWQHFHRGNGLPNAQIYSLAFNKAGTLFAGTQTNGLLIGGAQDGYASWRNAVSSVLKMPRSVAGRGLPSNVVNSVDVAEDGTLFVATKNGLARSSDEGKTFTYLRGADWEAKLAGLFDNPNLPALPDEEPADLQGTVLAEDDVRQVEAGENGQVWLAYFRKGCEVRDSRNLQLLSSASDCVRAMLPLPAQKPATTAGLIGNYGGAPGGISLLGRPQFLAQPETVGGGEFPADDKPLGVNDLKKLAEQIKAFAKPAAGSASFLHADFTTQGDWVGRYGQSLANLCGTNAFAGSIVADPANYICNFFTGPSNRPGANVYTYVHERNSNSPKVLFNPRYGSRISAELNDGSWQGKLFTPEMEGPDLWANFQIPDGPHRLALYFHSFDGHTGWNRYRDYLVEVKTGFDKIVEGDAAPVLASARARDFWHGNYTNFLVQGPGRFLVKITRQGSSVTKLIGLFINKCDSSTTTKFFPEPDVNLANETSPTVVAALELWQAAGNSPEWNYPARILAYRVVEKEKKHPDLLALWRRQLPLWTPGDRADFEDYMARAAQAVKKE